MNNKPTLKWARWYIKRGLSVIPLKPKAKTPDGSVLPEGSWSPYTKRYARDDELVKWFGEGERNIGILAGSLSNLAIVDLDSVKALEYAMLKMHFPKTPAVRTTKGLHLYYKYEKGVTNFQARADLPDIDLRGEGGYVVAPPSTHPNGLIYKWQWPLSTYKIGKLPQIILAHSSLDKKAFEEIWKRGLSKGERDHEMTRQIGKWITQGLNDEQIIVLALEIAGRSDQPRGDIYSEKDIIKTLNSIRKKEERSGIDRDERSDDPKQGMMKIEDLEAMDLKISWIVTDLVPEEAITLFSAAGGTGKTRLCLKMASCIAQEKLFLNQKTKQKRVYYVDFENPLALLNDIRETQDLKNITLWHFDQSKKPKGERFMPPKLSDDDWDWYEKALEPGSVLFVDTLRSAMVWDENSSEFMSVIMGRLKQLRENLGLTIVILHHTPKSNYRIYKGSTALSDLADHTLLLYPKGLQKRREYDPDQVDREKFGGEYMFGTPEESKSRYLKSLMTLILKKDVGFVEITLESDDASLEFEPEEGQK